MSLVNLDFEVRSFIDLPDRGLDVYATDKSTEVICMAYSIDGGPVKLWTPETAMPQFMYAEDTIFQGWNVAFEVNIMRHVLGINVPWERTRDTMAWAAANNCPQSLEEAAIFLGTADQKDPVGKRLIQKLCKPHKGEFNKDPALLKQMYDYCIKDVKAEMAVGALLRPLTASEQEVYALTQQINDRGVPVDPNELQNAVRAVGEAQALLDNELVSLTGCKPSERAKLLSWLNAQGANMTDLTSEAVSTKLVNTNLDRGIKRALELRQAGSQTSTAKYVKMMEMQRAGRIRNTLMYHGSSTGRWAGRGIQPQNLPRPTVEVTEELIGSVLVRGEGGSMSELSSLVRSALVAPEGHTFVSYDYSSVENRVGVWLAGQQDKVELFKRGLDEYKTFSSQVLHKVPYDEVTKDQRQVSKSAVLGSLFGQGPKGLVKYAKSMGVSLTESQAKQAVDGYRSSYSRVKALWAACENAAIQAIQNPGNPFRAGDKLVLKVAKNALWMQLPSKRLICWQRPEIEEVLTPWNQLKPGVVVHSQNTYTRQWGLNQLIGSSIFQSAVQAASRDLLAEAIIRLDKHANIMVVMLCHDEILCEVKEEDAESAQSIISEIMSESPVWAESLPLASEGWCNKRYQK